MSAARTNDGIDVPVLIGVDDAGRIEAWVATRPGCVLFADNEEQALRGIAAAVDEYDRCLSPADFQPAEMSETTQQRTSVRILTRKQLLRVAHDIGESRWSERPGGGERTVVDVLHHVAHCEWWYVRAETRVRRTLVGPQSTQTPHLSRAVPHPAAAQASRHVAGG